MECIRQAVAFTRKRVPVIAGTGSNSTQTAISLSTEAQKAGADAILVVSPYYNKGTQAGLVQHFTKIAQSVELPMLLYNIPGRTGINIMPSTIAQLVKNVDNIVGVKSSISDIGEVVQLMEECNGEIDVYSGDDAVVLPYLSLGAKGVISVLSNIAPWDTHVMVMKYLQGDMQGSLELQLRYYSLIKALFLEVNPIGIKKALDLCGWNTGGLRLPLTEFEPEHTKILSEQLKKLGIITAE
jgi:4-hydroxy-tetrahydrodipicolinate synthase